MRIAMITLFVTAIPLGSAQADPYDDFATFADTAFVTSADPLILERFGSTLEVPSDWWEYVSETSVAVGFATNLPAFSYLEYGTDESYGSSTPPSDRRYAQHLHRLTGLTPGVTYEYRVVLEDEDGNVVHGANRTVTPDVIPGAIRIPDDMTGPPYVLDTPNAHYLVTSDLVAPWRAFEVTADSIVLDLGGHTVTYNPDFLIIEPMDWWSYVQAAGFGLRSMKNEAVEVYNGTIVQGPGQNGAHPDASAGFNPMFLREGAGHEVAGVVFDYGGSQMCGLYLSYPGPRSIAHHNVFVDRGVEVPNRHGLGSMSVAVVGVVGNVEVYNNLIKRTRQNALNGSVIRDNEIYVDSYATNSSGIIGLSDERDGSGNRIFGTGYHVYGIGWGRNNWWHDNFVHLVGQGPDFRYDEYGNQESLNGIRLTQYDGGTYDLSGSIVEDNLILITGGDCGTDGECTRARGLQYHSDPHVTDNLIRNNTIKVVVNDVITQAAAVVTQGLSDRCGTEAPLDYVGNRFISNVANVRIGDSAASGCNHNFYRNEFVRVGERIDYRTFVFGSSWPINEHHFFDSIYTGGASADLVEFSTGVQEISFGWTLTVSVTDDAGSPLVGAAVTLIDSADSTLASGSTDGAGLFAKELVEYDETSAGRNYHTPVLVRAEFAGLVDSASVSLDSTSLVTVVLTEATSAPAPGVAGPLMLSAYPSVSSGSTQFQLSRGPGVSGTLAVYDLRGRAVRRIEIPRRSMNVAWNGRDHSGRSVGAGVYFARVKAGSETASCRLVIVR
jgi:hypothetical protein